MGQDCILHPDFIGITGRKPGADRAKFAEVVERQNGLCVWSKFYGQATKSMRGDALAQVGEEGRGQLRKVSGRCKQPMIREYPNGGTQSVRTRITVR